VSFVHGKSSRLLLGNSLFSGFLRGFEAGDEIEMGDGTTYGSEGHTYVPGLETGTLSMDGLLDNDATVSGQDAKLNAELGAQNGSVITAAPAGLALGAIVRLIEVRETNYALSSPVGEVVSFNASWQSEGQVDQGVSLHDATSEGATANGSNIDNAILTANGAAASLHVVTNTRSTATTIKVQHSVDNVVWVDLITFTVVGAGATTAQKSAVAGTVNRHLRAQWTLTAGTGAITFAVAAARR
jgi:hypothetical protein